MKRSILALGLIAAIPMAALALDPKDPPAPKPTAKEPKEKAKGPKVGEAAPEIIGKDASGKTVKLSDLKGNVVVVDFWATWCPPCRAAMPEVQKLHEKYAGKNVKVIGVAVWERPHTPAKEGETKPERVHNGKPLDYMTAMKFTYTTWTNGDDSAKNYGVQGIPAMFVIDADGKLVLAHSGFDPKKGLKDIDEAVGKLAKDAKASAEPKTTPRTAG